MFNPVIIVAVIIQSVVAKSSRIAGAILGYVITTGILLWGISLYGEGSQIALFGIPLSEPIFFIACLVWYGFDTREFLAARKGIIGVNKTELASELAARGKLADLTKAEDYPPLQRARELLALGKDDAALLLLLDELADAHRRGRNIYRELIEQLVSHIFDIYSRNNLEPSFDHKQYNQMVEEFRQTQEQVIPLIERYGLERAMVGSPRFGKDMPNETVDLLRDIDQKVERLNKEIPTLVGQLPRTLHR